MSMRDYAYDPSAVRIRVWVTLGSETVEDVVEVDRARWLELTPAQRDRLGQDLAVDHRENEIQLGWRVMGDET